MPPQVALCISALLLSAAASAADERCSAPQDLVDGREETLSLLQKTMRLERSRTSAQPGPPSFRKWPAAPDKTGEQLEVLQRRASTAPGPTSSSSPPPREDEHHDQEQRLEDSAHNDQADHHVSNFAVVSAPSPAPPAHQLHEHNGEYAFGRDIWEDDEIIITADVFKKSQDLSVVFLGATGIESFLIRFLPDSHHVIRNALVSSTGEWGEEESSGSWPLQLGKPLRFSLRWTYDTWQVSINGERRREFDLERGTVPPASLRLRGDLINPKVFLQDGPSLAEVTESAQLGGSALEGKQLPRGVLEFTFEKPLEAGDAVRLVADNLGNGPWYLNFIDSLGNVALSWSPRPEENAVYRNSGSGLGDSIIWGLQESHGGWPFQHGKFTVEFEWTWSLWVVSIDGIRRPGLDFYHRTSLPITGVRLTPGLSNATLSLVDVRAGGFRGQNGCDGGSGPGGGSGMLHKYRIALAGLRETYGNGLLRRGALHDVVGPHGVLMISLARKPERFLSSLPALVAAGIVPTPFPATDAECSSPEGLDLGMRRLAAREDTTGAKAGERARKAGQSVQEWWHETWVAQAIADSHRRALQAALGRTDAEWTAILEDDAIPAGDPEAWDKAFADAWHILDPAVKFVRLGWCGSGPPYYESFKFVPGGFSIGQWMPRVPKFDKMESGHESDGGCTTGYLVHRSIIPEMLRIFPCREVVDSCFLWQVFMKPAEGPKGTVEWGSIHMANLDAGDRQPLPRRGAETESIKYIQRGVLRQDHTLPSTRKKSIESGS